MSGNNKTKNNDQVDDAAPVANENGKESSADELGKVQEVVKDMMPGGQGVPDALKLQDVTLTLKEVSAPTKPGEEALRQMEGMDMAKLIGAPINAAVEAHYNAAKKMLGCINDIGVKDGTVAVVTFSFFKNGKLAKMSIPLLTLVPITAMRIKEMKYDFKIKISAETSVGMNTGAESSFGYNAAIGKDTSQAKKEGAEDKKEVPDAKEDKAKEKSKEEPAKKEGMVADPKESKTTTDAAAVSAAVKNSVKTEPTFGASFSSKKDSKATQNSKYSVESSMDIGITVVSDDNLPGGVSRMLEILNGAINVYNPNGELIVSANSVRLVDGYAVVNTTYYDGEGNSAPDKIKCVLNGESESASKVQLLNTGDSVQLLFSAPGTYVVSADKLKNVVVVMKEEAKAAAAE